MTCDVDGYRLFHPLQRYLCRLQFISGMILLSLGYQLISDDNDLYITGKYWGEGTNKKNKSLPGEVVALLMFISYVDISAISSIRS